MEGGGVGWVFLVFFPPYLVSARAEMQPTCKGTVCLKMDSWATCGLHQAISHRKLGCGSALRAMASCERKHKAIFEGTCIGKIGIWFSVKTIRSGRGGMLEWTKR